MQTPGTRQSTRAALSEALSEAQDEAADALANLTEAEDKIARLEQALQEALADAASQSGRSFVFLEKPTGLKSISGESHRPAPAGACLTWRFL